MEQSTSKYSTAAKDKDKDSCIEYVTKEEFDDRIKDLERKIVVLEAKLYNAVSGWDTK